MIKKFLKDLTDQFDKLMVNLVALTAGFLMLALIAVVVAWPLQLLWNECVVVMVDGTNEISILKSMALFVLIKIVHYLLKSEIIPKK